jgi:hypothetical protein
MCGRTRRQQIADSIEEMGNRMRREQSPHNQGLELVSATEIACWVYCPEQWRFEYGLKVKPENQPERAAGKRHHAWKSLAERFAGGAIGLGRVLMVLGIVLVLLLWLVRR